jgi:hypothetical protein
MGVAMGFLGLTRMNMVFLFIKGPEEGRLIVWWFSIKGSPDTQMGYIEGDLDAQAGTRTFIREQTSGEKKINPRFTFVSV